MRWHMDGAGVLTDKIKADPPATPQEWNYLQWALIKTYHVDGGRTDILKQVALEIMDEWVSAGDNPTAIRAFNKADFNIR